MTERPDQRYLETLATDVFSVFGENPKAWPDIVQVNRSGYTDVNIRGIWLFEDRIEFYHSPLASLDSDTGDFIGTRWQGSGEDA